MASEAFKLKTQKWIKSVSTIQSQAKKRFAPEDNAAFIKCLQAVLTASYRDSTIDKTDLEILKKYTLNTQPDDFKAAVENFFIWLDKNNSPSQLKELNEVVYEEGFYETLQKIHDSAAYEQQQAAEALMEQDAQQWCEDTVTIQENIEKLSKGEVDAFRLRLSALWSVTMVSIPDQIFALTLEDSANSNGMNDVLMRFIHLSDKYFDDVNTLKKFRTFFTPKQLDAIQYFANKNAENPLDSLKLTSLTLKFKDHLGKVVENPSTIYNNIHYLYFTLGFEAVQSLKEVPLKVSVFYPDGKLMHTYEKSFLADHQNKKIYADGIGSTEGLSYSKPGIWTVKFSVNGKELRTDKFKIEESPNPYNPSVKINSIRFDNCDYENKTINRGFLPYNTQYVTPVINYTRIQNLGCIRLGYRIYNPDGSLRSSNSSPSGLSSITRIVPAETGEIKLTGLGNANGNCYSPGTYKFELVQGKNVLYSTSFTIHPAQQTSPKPVPAPTKPATTSSRPTYTPPKKKSNGCISTIIWLLIISVICLGGYWYCNRNTGEIMYTVGDFSLLNDDGSLINTISGPAEIELLETNNERAKIKYKGQKGYIPANLVVSEAELDHLNRVINDNPALETDFGRKALYDFISNNPSVVNNPGNWRVYNNASPVRPASVMTPKPQATGVESVLAFVVSSENRYQRGVYHLLSNGEIKRIMNQEVPVGDLMTRISYNNKTSKYDISYAKDDKIVTPSGQATTSPSKPFLITDISLVTVDKNNKEKSAKVTKKSEFVAPKISYNSYEKGRIINLTIKVYDPTGKLVQESTSPDGATYTVSIPNVSKRGQVLLTGWRNLDHTPSWDKSGYRFEIWNDKGMLASCKLKLK